MLKISERIALLKAGYTKDEINSMIAEDSKVSEEPAVPEVSNNDNNDYMQVLSVLANEVRDLKDAVYSSNISNTNVDNNRVIKAEDILGSLINPKPNKEDN